MSIKVHSQKINKNYKIHPKKTDQIINIDGVLQEEVWGNTETANNFFMILPTDGKQANQQSEVKILYDENNIYFGVVFFNNSVQGEYTVESLKRDFSFGKNDNLLISIDPFNNLTTGFSFGLNAYGAQWDGTMYNGGKIDLNWDSKWVSEVSFDKEKWTCEISIPLKSIRYKEGVKEWGINFGRLDLKASEKSSWAPVPRQFPSVSLAHTGVLVWDSPPPKQGRNISLIPYSLSNISKTKDDKTKSNKIGGDIKVSVSSALNLDFTINPNFSQAEVDQQVTNLDRFELFYPERRQFFLENADLFANFGYETLRPFFSRRIGLGVPIDAGLRLSGNINEKWRIGLMDIQTQNIDDIGLPKQNFGVFTIQKRVFDRSSIGLILINKESFIDEKNKTNSDSSYNRNVGLEYNYGSANNLWNGKAFFLNTYNSNQIKNDHSFASHLQYNSVNWKARIQQEYVGEDFNAEVGYVPRKGYYKFISSLGYLFYKNDSYIVSYGPNFSRTYFFDQSYNKTDLLDQFSYVINFSNRSKLNVFFIKNYIKLLQDFDPLRSNISSLIKGSEHEWTSFGFEFISKPQNNFTYKVNGLIGGYYQGGKRKSLSAEFGYRFQPYVSINSIVNYNSINLESPWNNSDFWLIGSKLDITLTNKLFFSNLYQYNKQFDLWSFNSRFQWRYKPASDLFLVFNSNEVMIPEEIKSWSINLKLNYWLNLN
tara:strand:+ start:16 stop:2142 length:2127 start_codon:yes stop_codon:yes gene_type:complete